MLCRYFATVWDGNYIPGAYPLKFKLAHALLDSLIKCAMKGQNDLFMDMIEFIDVYVIKELLRAMKEQVVSREVKAFIDTLESVMSGVCESNDSSLSDSHTEDTRSTENSQSETKKSKFHRKQ